MIPALGRTLCVLLLIPSLAQGAVRVEISGVSGAELDNIRARLSIQRRSAENLDEAEVERLHQRAKKEVRAALQPFGYYEPQLESRLEGRPPGQVARYRVDPGPLTRLVAYDVELIGEGAHFTPLMEAATALRARRAERLLHERYNAAKRELADAAYRYGFLDARWAVSELRVEPERREARAVLHLDTGPRYFFGEVSLEQDILEPAFLERYISLKPGQPFDPKALLAQQFALGDLDYFDTVDIDPQRDRADDQHRVPILIRLTPRARAHYDLGLGYGTDTGARATIANEWRRVNDKGHKVLADLRLAEVKNTIRSEYRIPIGRLPGDHLAFTAGSQAERLADGKTFSYTVGGGVNRSGGNWKRRYYLEYTHEDTEIGATTATADLLIPGLALTRTDLDDPIYARNGWYLFGDVHGADQNLISTTSFIQTHLLGRGVLPLGSRARLLGRAELGLSFVDDFDELPASQRFFAGGDQSVRGYAYQSLGPRDDTGAVIGGKYLQAYSLETEFQVRHNWGAALFVDAGGAADDPEPDLSYGVGVGARYRAPFGSAQIDLAHPLEGSGLRLHIGVRVGL